MISVRKGQIKPLRILILGGTGFIGPHQVEYALSRGHTITLFNRGKTNPSLFPTVEKLIGDRNAPEGYVALKGRAWDVVIDNPTQIPRWVREAGAAFQAAYPNAPVSTYGALKVRCEMEARASFGDKALIVRPGLIVGPGDLTDRFSYWPVRIEQGGEVLAPGSPDDYVGFIDARDLTEFMIRLCEQGATGTYNAVGPRYGMTTSEMLYGIKAVTSGTARFTWVDTDFLLERKLRPYSDLPVWMAPRGENVGWARMNISKALGAGLAFRPLAETARDTLAYYHTQPAERQAALRAGLSPDKEREALVAWHAKSGP